MYVRSLRRIMEFFTAGEMPDILHDLCAWAVPILPREYLTERQTRFPPGEWERLKFERRQRNALGVFVAHEWIEVSTIRQEALRGRYPASNPEWELFEVPPEFMAELPPVIVYYWFAMANDPLSSLWAVFASEWVTIIAKRVLWIARDGRLFLLPDNIRQALRSFSYQPFLVLADDDATVDLLLDALDRIDWSRVPVAQGHRYSRGWNHSPGLTCNASTAASGYWLTYEFGRGQVVQTEFLRVSPRRALPATAGMVCRQPVRADRRARPEITAGVIPGLNSPKGEEEDVVMAEVPGEREESTPPPKKRGLCSGWT